MGRNNDQDVHDRHSNPNPPEEDGTEDAKPQVKERESQAIRDAHFYENGVGPDGKGGVAPESEQ
jgi:hypothetical protein